MDAETLAVAKIEEQLIRMVAVIYGDDISGHFDEDATPLQRLQAIEHELSLIE